MENKPLHARKIEILSRLIKADQISLDEALLLLKDETPEENIVVEPFPSYPTQPWNNPYWYATPNVGGGTFQITGGSANTTLLTTN
jgi:hypothetical protein